jgi:lysozyme
MELKNWIKSYAGFNPYPFLDKSGKVIIGWGRIIDDHGISKEEADLMFDNDFARSQKELLLYSWFVNQPKNVQNALVNMCFNLGIKRLLTFKKMIAALIVKDYTKAAMEALDSKWANQSEQRAKDVALMMRQG